MYEWWQTVEAFLLLFGALSLPCIAFAIETRRKNKESAEEAASIVGETTE